jgi:anthranilate synthase component 1
VIYTAKSPVRPTPDEFKKLASEGIYTVVPVSCELFADIRTPIEVLKILKSVSSRCFLLESVIGGERWGRYTFLGFDPKLEVTCTAGKMTVGDAVFRTSSPSKHIRRLLEGYRSPRLDYLPPFTGGLVGYFAYDYIKYAEPTLRLDALDDEGFRDVDLMLFDRIIAFDNLRQKMVLVASAEPTAEGYERAVAQLDKMCRLVTDGSPITDTGGAVTGEFRALFDREGYCELVELAKHHIREGDIRQIVLSNRFDAPFEGSLLDTYRRLRTINPSPYMFYLSSPELEVAGASPETLVKLQDGVLRTFPLAGSRPRGKTPDEDAALERELLADPKELSEHNMLVDLGKSDLGKVSVIGSVDVEELRTVVRYSHIMHISSTVRGVIRPGCDAFDAVEAVLPAGTLSGAPKLRACQLINELEGCRRGLYGGAIGYIDFTGNLDTCIAIRLAYKKNGRVYVRSGAGIVADSVPEREHEECKNKAAALLAALKEE